VAMRAPHRRGSAMLAGATLLAALAACTGADPSDPGDVRDSVTSTVTPSPATSASPADIAGEQALAAYVGMWNDMVEAARTSNWQDPELGRYATKDALRVITGSLYADHRSGVITKGRPTYDPEVISVRPQNVPTIVMISDCADSSNALKYRKKDGTRVGDLGGGRRQITAEVKSQDDGKWRVTRFAVQELGSC